MITLTSLQVYNSIFFITEQNNTIELYTATFDEFSFGEIRDELDEFLSFSDITPYHPQHGIIGPRKIQAYR